MTTRKRERDHARKRHEKWLAHQQAVRARRRRHQVVAGAVVGVLVLSGAVALVLDRTARTAPDPGATPGADTTQPTAPPEETRPVPDPALAEARTWTTTLSTSVGDITLELDGEAAPQAVASFVTLAEEGWFDSTDCHRLTTSGIFVLQCGDPTGTGTGGPGYGFGPIENAPADDVYPAGTVAMARQRDGAESMGSQFFLVYEDSTIPSDSAGGYTVFGRVTEGMDVLQEVAEAGVLEGTETPATAVTIEGVELE